ncbi:MAG: adenylate/guanylate cyclase domain-containing protein [Leptospiraceae bacterium]|nr:adenylate/guanylate cyclase domain-containing protein [Leptospiraceae bacterium]
MRKKVGLVLIITSVVIPLMLVGAYFLMLALVTDNDSAWGIFYNILTMIIFIHLAYLLVGILLFFKEKLIPQGDQWHTLDYIWIGLSAISLIGYILVYIVDTTSILYQLVLFGLFDLRSYLLWVFFDIIVVSVYPLIVISERHGWNRKTFGTLAINITIALFLGLMLQNYMFRWLENEWVSTMYSWTRNPGGERIYLKHVRDPYNPDRPYAASRFCPSPEDKIFYALNEQRANELLQEEQQQSGIELKSDFAVADGIRSDIRIIGITTSDITELEGRWPLDWGIYAQVADRMAQLDRNYLVYDINFLDDKGVFGGLECGRKFQCSSLPGQPMVRQTEVLADSIANSPNPVISDYPVETELAVKESELNYDERLEVLLETTAIRNVHNGSYAVIWARLPIPPIVPVGKALDNAGLANVLIDPVTKINRKVPIIIRVPNFYRANQPDYNPSVDDWYLPGVAFASTLSYYGVDPQKDVEVDFLKGYVKIKNIPERTLPPVVNWETMETTTPDIMKYPNPERTVTIPIDRYGLMNINFRGGLHCIHHDRILDVAENFTAEEIADRFDGKIALVAMYYATGVDTAKDIHLSPYGNMAGIEHQAYAINTILNQDFSYEAPNSVNLFILLVLAIISGLILPRVPLGVSFFITISISVVYTLVAWFVTFDLYSYLHAVPTVIVEQIFIFLVFIGFRALAEEENVKFIRNTFSKFVSQDVVDELLTNPEAIALGGSKKEVSVFFSDVRGFTTISEALGPEELVKLLNEYLSEMTELIIQYRGTIDKYMGDAIMAFWGAPVPNDDHAYYTCVAAVAQSRALIDLQRRWSERNIPVLDIGIGINSGAAVVGNMGSSRRMDYTLMGDTVNLGSRLEGITKTYGVKICMSEFTYERVKDRVYARELDLVRVKGKTEPVRIYELMGLKNEADLEKLKTHQAT